MFYLYFRGIHTIYRQSGAKNVADRPHDLSFCAKKKHPYGCFLSGHSYYETYYDPPVLYFSER